MIVRKLKGYENLKEEVYQTDIKKVSVSNMYLSLSTRGVLRVHTHYVCDGPSGGAIPTKTFMRGAFGHDALYQLMREGLLDRKYRKTADLLLKRVCLEDGMNKFRAWYVYHAVRLRGKKYTYPRKKPWIKIIKTGEDDGSKSN